MGKRKAKTTECFKSEIYDLVQDEYSVLGEYITNKTKIKMKHNVCGHEWDVEPSSFLRGARCPKCANNRRRKSHQQFVKEVYELVGDEYEVLGKYINSGTHIKMRHNVCGTEFDMIPNNFLKGNRCNHCGIIQTANKTRKTHDEFISEVFELIGDEYTVLSEYKGSSKKVKIKHNTCGNIFEITPSGFLNGNRCKPCSIKSRARKSAKTHDEFIKQVCEKYNDDYIVLDKYIDNKTKIKFKHKYCGYEFMMTPGNFLRSVGCPKCSNSIRITLDDFKKEVFDLTGNDYTVLGEYKNAHSKIKIRHNICGNIYDGCRNMFLKGQRCPQCSSSKGEDRVKRYLQNKSIKFRTQEKFDNLFGIGNGLLKYDFYLPDYNLLIEYNGKQHYEPIDYFGGECQLKIQQEHDNRKEQYAKDNNIEFLVIPYWDFENIENILNTYLKEAV